jgi:hypothetical protein
MSVLTAFRSMCQAPESVGYVSCTCVLCL